MIMLGYKGETERIFPLTGGWAGIAETDQGVRQHAGVAPRPVGPT
jgi:hypothetical protein